MLWVRRIIEVSRNILETNSKIGYRDFKDVLFVTMYGGRVYLMQRHGLL